MLLACDTAGKLVNVLTKLAENQEKDKTKKPAEQPKKTETKKAADKTETPDDLSFLE